MEQNQTDITVETHTSTTNSNNIIWPSLRQACLQEQGNQTQHQNVTYRDILANKSSPIIGRNINKINKIKTVNTRTIATQTEETKTDSATETSVDKFNEVEFFNKLKTFILEVLQSGILQEKPSSQGQLLGGAMRNHFGVDVNRESEGKVNKNHQTKNKYQPSNASNRNQNLESNNPSNEYTTDEEGVLSSQVEGEGDSPFNIGEKMQLRRDDFIKEKADKRHLTLNKVRRRKKGKSK